MAEEKSEKQVFDEMDSVDRRDKQGHISSRSFTERGKENFDKIKWNKSG